MGSKVNNVAKMLCFFVLLACIVNAQSRIFDVSNYGAIADGKTEISKALLSAWEQGCASTEPSIVVIPNGVYLLGTVTLSGPCKAAIEVQVHGTMKAPSDPGVLEEGNWISFNYIDQFTLSGGGTFDGQGQVAWSVNNCHKNQHCKSLPINLRFNFITNGLVQGVKSLDSKNFHVNVLGCKNITFNKFRIVAPAESINTDGIHIGKSNGVYIKNSKISTGDDCISLGDGSQQVYVKNVQCGPGHGISVGSLGKYQNEEPVKGVFVSNCTLMDTDNGIRIKTWPALFGGAALDMHFEDILIKNVSNPIIIDQVYCPWNLCNNKAPSKVKISDVSFKNIRGTSTTPVAVQLSCSSGNPCENVELANIDLTYDGIQGQATSKCSYVNPIVTGTFNPSGCT